MTDADRDVARNLLALARGGTAIIVRAATDDELRGFDPSLVCHDNARRWVELHPTHRIVRGYIASTGWLLDQHSVVDTGTALLDITPRVARRRLPFIPHPGTEDEFWRLPAQLLAATP